MVPIRNTTGHLYPIRDSCNRTGDPEEGCVSTDALFYNTNIRFRNDSFPVTLSHRHSTIVNDTLSPVLIKRIGVHELDCDHNTFFFCDFLIIESNVFLLVASIMDLGTPKKRFVNLRTILLVYVIVFISTIIILLFWINLRRCDRRR